MPTARRFVCVCVVNGATAQHWAAACCSSGCETCDVYGGEVVSLSPSPQIVGQILRVYDPRRQGGPVVPLGIGQLRNSGAPLPVLKIIMSP